MVKLRNLGILIDFKEEMKEAQAKTAFKLLLRTKDWLWKCLIVL